MQKGRPIENQVTELCDSPWGRSFSVLIVEDHEIVREGLHRLVARALSEDLSSLLVSYAGSLQDAKSLVSAGRDAIDLILLDLELEDAEAVDCLNCLRNEWKGLPVAVVSASEEVGISKRLMALGVLGFIPKRSNVAIITNAIRLIASGGRYFPIESMEAELAGDEPARNPVLDNELISANGEFIVDDELLERLSPRQQAVLALMSEGMSNKEIAKMLSLSVGTTKNYVSNILRALGVSGRVSAIRIATTWRLRNAASQAGD